MFPCPLNRRNLVQPQTALAARGVMAGQPLRCVRAVFPVFVTGLHCGCIGPVDTFVHVPVFPVFVTGLRS